jgi:TolB-like protein
VAGLVAKKKRVNPMVWAGAAVVVIGLGVGGWLMSRGGAGSGKIQRIGVMPIEDISGKDSTFVTAMHDALTNALSQLGVVGVASRTEMLRYKKTTKTDREVAKELNVDALVQATVYRAGDVMRINVQFTNPVTTRSLWASTYNPNVTDVLAAQSTVVNQIKAGIDSVLTVRKPSGVSQ